MATEHVLAIDAGTSGVRCLLTDLQGHIVALCHQEWGYQSPDEIAPLGREFTPAVFWSTICDTVRGAIQAAAVNPRTIIGIGATSQREGAVFLDKAGKELYAGPNIDLRALTEGITWDSQFGAEIYAITGHLPSFLFVPARLKWFENNQPAVYRRIATVLTISDWIVYRLSGERVGELCGASEQGLIDISHRQWSDKLRYLLALPGNIYPELVPAGRQAGKVTGRTAEETGILEGTPVVMAAPDTHCGLLGMGIREQGQAGIVLGWSAPVQVITAQPIFDAAAKIWSSCYLLPARWLLESSAGESGNVYRWLKEVMFDREESSEEAVYHRMDELARAVPAGAEEVTAFLGPAAMDMSHLTLRFGGFLFPVPMSATNVQKGHLIRASLENLCFAIKANCQQLEAISGLKIRQIALGGGMTRSRCLRETLPNVLDMPLSVFETAEVSGLGAAICAAVGSGAYPSLEAGTQAMIPRAKVIEPEPLSALEYSDYYQRWTATARWLEKLGEGMK